MNIGFDASPIISPIGGISSYVKNLLKALLDLKSRNTFFAYIPLGTSSLLRWPEEKYRDNLKWIETSRWGFRGCGINDQLDLYHGTNFKLQTSGRFGTILTIHDLWLDRYPEYSKKFFGQRLSFFQTKRRVQRANHIIAVSNFTANEIQEFYEVSVNKISVVHHGISREFFPDLRSDKDFDRLRVRFGIPNKPYIFFVGGANPRKNHKILFQAFSSNRFLSDTFSIVAVGNTSFRNLTMKKTIQDFGLHNNVVCIEQLDLEDLRALYSRAAAFVFPSRYEGFGFPVLEAMACGTPVLTSKCSALPEVAGDAALLVELENPKALEQAMVKTLQDAELRQRLREKGLKQAEKFKWSQAAEQMLKIYQTLCQSS